MLSGKDDGFIKNAVQFRFMSSITGIHRYKFTKCPFTFFLTKLKMLMSKYDHAKFYLILSFLIHFVCMKISVVLAPLRLIALTVSTF